MRRRRDLARHHPGRDGDDGPPRHRRDRGLRPCWLPPRCRCLADRRARRAAARGRASDRAGDIAQANRASLVRASTSEEERLKFWAGRKAAFPAVGRISPDYLCMDGTIPRKNLPAVLSAMSDLSAKYGLACANVFHAGDGNLHPLILFDAGEEDQLERAEEFGAEILKLCVRMGGVLTGEHGSASRSATSWATCSARSTSPIRSAQMRLRHQGPAQSRQDVPGAASLRRARPHACPPRQPAIRRHSEVLTT